MTKIVQIHRLATAQAAAYTGPDGEVIKDTGLNTLRVQDGATPGGNLLLSGANNLEEISSPSAARSNLGLGGILTAPTYQSFTASGTYTPNVGVARFEATLKGAGGGGSGGGTAALHGGNGGAGGDSIFNGIHAQGGRGAVGATDGGGTSPGPGGANGAGAAILRIPGAAGSPGFGINNPTIPSAPGGSGGGKGGGQYGTDGIANSGGGGGGGFCAGTTGSSGAGGGEGEEIHIAISGGLAASYAFTIGTGGALGVPGSGSGVPGKGADGYLLVKEFYA